MRCTARRDGAEHLNLPNRSKNDKVTGARRWGSFCSLTFHYITRKTADGCIVHLLSYSGYHWGTWPKHLESTYLWTDTHWRRCELSNRKWGCAKTTVVPCVHFGLDSEVGKAPTSAPGREGPRPSPLIYCRETDTRTVPEWYIEMDFSIASLSGSDWLHHHPSPNLASTSRGRRVRVMCSISVERDLVVGNRHTRHGADSPGSGAACDNWMVMRVWARSRQQAPATGPYDHRRSIISSLGIHSGGVDFMQLGAKLTAARFTSTYSFTHRRVKP